MSTKKYFLVFLSKYFKYYSVIGIGVNLKKVQTQSKNFILNFLRSKCLLKYTNNYSFTFDFEILLKNTISNGNNIIYEQNIFEESFSFYLMSDNEITFLKNDYDLLDRNYIFTNLFFVEDKKIATYIFNNSNYDFDTKIIDPVRNYLNSINLTNLKSKIRSQSI